ncbi:MAG: RHS repeat-associated core domain-containing protein [Paludibacter sp.]|nr:RHS repeat-associated core domain-containing protein [Paludibacter sp.]
MALANEAGTVVERYAYDPWGKRRNPADWTQDDTRTSWIIDRGYTMHEHLDAFGIINMNGRVYDPLTAMFFSPDPFVQAPESWLNYNRYAYCYGNPFKYVDPNGEWIHLLIGGLIGGTVNWLANGAEFTWKGLAYFGVGALAGALGAGMGAGISSALAGGSFGAGFVGSSAALTATSSFITGAAIGGGAGFSSGFTSGFGNGIIQGKKFGESLWQGTYTGLIAGASGALLGGISGGIDAVKDGRDFWGGKPWETTADYSLPNGNLPIHEQSDMTVGCTQETLESIAEYKGQTINVADKSQGADFAQLANEYGFNTKTIMPGTTNSEQIVGAQLHIGNPSAITYNNSGTMHTVGVNRIQMQQVPRIFGSGVRTRIIIQVMDPLRNTYQNLSTFLFRSGYIRVVVP